ncbi:Transposase, partial [Caligus rogercresseyi]
AISLGLLRVNHQHRRQDQTATDERQGCVIYYELLKPGETVNTQRYRQQMTDLDRVLLEKRPEYQQRQHKVILLHDNAPAHKAKQILQHAAYSPDLAPSDYYLFASMGHALAEQHFTSYEDVRKWLEDWFASKEQ